MLIPTPVIDTTWIGEISNVETIWCGGYLDPLYWVKQCYHNIVESWVRVMFYAVIICTDWVSLKTPRLGKQLSKLVTAPWKKLNNYGTVWPDLPRVINIRVQNFDPPPYFFWVSLSYLVLDEWARLNNKLENNLRFMVDDKRNSK